MSRSRPSAPEGAQKINLGAGSGQPRCGLRGLRGLRGSGDKSVLGQWTFARRRSNGNEVLAIRIGSVFPSVMSSKCPYCERRQSSLAARSARDNCPIASGIRGSTTASGNDCTNGSACLAVPFHDQGHLIGGVLVQPGAELRLIAVQTIDQNQLVARPLVEPRNDRSVGPRMTDDDQRPGWRPQARAAQGRGEQTRQALPRRLFLGGDRRLGNDEQGVALAGRELFRELLIVPGLVDVGIVAVNVNHDSSEPPIVSGGTKQVDGAGRGVPTRTCTPPASDSTVTSPLTGEGATTATEAQSRIAFGKKAWITSLSGGG